MHEAGALHLSLDSQELGVLDKSPLSSKPRFLLCNMWVSSAHVTVETGPQEQENSHRRLPIAVPCVESSREEDPRSLASLLGP
jgi:hypothetical protein